MTDDVNPNSNAHFVRPLCVVFVGNPTHARMVHPRIVEIDQMLFQKCGNRCYVPSVIMVPDGPVTVSFTLASGSEVGMLGSN